MEFYTTGKPSKNFMVDRAFNLYRSNLRAFPLLTRPKEITLAKQIEEHIKEILLIVAKFPDASGIIGSYFTEIINGERKLSTLFYGFALDEDLTTDPDPKPNMQILDEKRLRLWVLEYAIKRQIIQFGLLDERTLKSQQELGEYLTTFKWAPAVIEKLVNAVQSLPTGSDTNEIKHTKYRLSHAFKELKRAKQHMVESNLRLVFSIGKKYRYCGLPYLDVLQEGNIGLIQAVDRFNYRQGYAFSTYAVWWIRHAILKFIAKHQSMIPIPTHKTKLLHQLNQGTAALLQTLGRQPSIAELAEWMEYPEQEVRTLLGIASKPVSLQTPIPDQDHCLEDLLEDPQSSSPVDLVSAQELSELTLKALAQLPLRHAKVLQMRFGIGMPDYTLEEIGRELNISKGRVGQIEAKALRTLRRQQALIDKIKGLLD